MFEAGMIDELNEKSTNSNLLPGLLPTASQLLPSSLLSSPAEDKQVKESRKKILLVGAAFSKPEKQNRNKM